jgi:hypothetical protein
MESNVMEYQDIKVSKRVYDVLSNHARSYEAVYGEAFTPSDVIDMWADLVEGRVGGY